MTKLEGYPYQSGAIRARQATPGEANNMMQTAHIAACRLLDAYASGTIMLYELVDGMARVGRGIPAVPVQGSIDPQSGLRY